MVEQVAMDKLLRGLPNDLRRVVGKVKVSLPRKLTAALETALATKEIGTAEARTFQPCQPDLGKAPENWRPRAHGRAHAHRVQPLQPWMSMP